MYVKMFQSIYDGSLATRGPWQALVTFQQLLVLCDKDGVVDMTPEVISRRTTIPIDIVTQGLAVLEMPDPESRRSEAEGRRIVKIAENRAWGWQIVNYAHYRAIRTADERREYMRTYMRERREKEPDKPKRERVNGVSFTPPEWVNREKWDAWIKIRPAKARTADALKAACEKLEGFKGMGFDPNKIVATSLANGWQGLFPPDRNGAGNGQTTEERVAELEEERKHAQRRHPVP